MAYLLVALFLVLTYFVASIPFGLVLAKLFNKKDLRQHGSNNIGATNATRVLGKKFGLLTLILDASKGAVMIIIARLLFVCMGSSLDNIIALVGLIAVIGHVFPIYLKFKGGKGVATTIAVLFAINPIIGIVNILIWLLVFFISKVSAIASLSSILIASLFAIYWHAPISQIILCLILLCLVTFRHKENILRIRKGRENKI
jgi:glycerol-3-phosphate acyltransferase PlsY